MDKLTAPFELYEIINALLEIEKGNRISAGRGNIITKNKLAKMDDYDVTNNTYAMTLTPGGVFTLAVYRDYAPKDGSLL